MSASAPSSPPAAARLRPLTPDADESGRETDDAPAITTRSDVDTRKGQMGKERGCAPRAHHETRTDQRWFAKAGCWFGWMIWCVKQRVPLGRPFDSGTVGWAARRLSPPKTPQQMGRARSNCTRVGTQIAQHWTNTRQHECKHQG